MRRVTLNFIAILAIATIVSPAVARRGGGLAGYDHRIAAPAGSADVPGAVPALRTTRAAANTTVLYTATFDAGASCTEQGWTKVDLTAQIGDFFHVDDYAGLNAANFAPLEGTKSLWCGARPEASGPLCAYATLPGYGSNWNQAFCTRNCLAVSGDGMLDVSFLARFDSEPDYDYTVLEYTLDCSGVAGWTQIDGGGTTWTGKLPATNWLAGATYGGSYNVGGTGPVKVRLHFFSDGAWSDQDGSFNSNGAVHVDNLQAEGLPVENFESESVGATSADDWESCTPPGYGSFAGLEPGAYVLQEDPCARDLSCIWTFFQGSAFNYACGGHPEQLALPFGNAIGQYLNNEIWSPPIAVTGSGATMNLAFSVYRELPLDNVVFYVWHVRDLSSGCASPWEDTNFIFFGAQKDWFSQVESIGQFFDLSTATSIQVALGAVDLCAFLCGTYGSGACHSHAPLLDNVKIYRVDNEGPQWTVRDIDQFQDNFAADGTLTGTVRADVANDINVVTVGTIIPGDSASVRVSDPLVGLGTDPGVGGAAVYCYVSVWPQGQAGKSGNALTQNSVRWPVVGSWTDASGTPWTCIRTDTVRTNGFPQAGTFCVDLNDNLFVPGDTVCFFYTAKNASGMEAVAFGSNLGLSSADREQAAANPSEFTCLPAGGYNRGGDVLYVDGMDGRGAQPYWDTAFAMVGSIDKVDRYDVRGPSSSVSNRLAGRVTNVQTQLVGCYRQILWDCGDLPVTLGDGSGNPEKTDDYQLLDDFLNNLAYPGGVFLCGDDVAEQLSNYGGTSAITFRTSYLTYNLTTSNHEPLFGISPAGVHRNGGCYRDDFVIYGGCPLLNDFDVLTPTGSTTMEIGYGTPGTTNGAVIANATVNGNGANVGVVLAGFSFIYIRDDDTNSIPDRAQFLYDTRTWLGDLVAWGDPVQPLAANSLSQNYPNPFNPQTTIAFSVRQRGRVQLVVYNVSGARVRTLANEDFAAGMHTAVWDGRNDAGQPVASGVYFYKLVARDFTQTRKMVLLK